MRFITGVNDKTLSKSFVHARDKIASDKQAFLSHSSASELAKSNKKIYLSDDGLNGFILDNGDIQNLFSVNHHGIDNLLAAIKEGGYRLDCFDGYLVSFYSHFGFKEVKRESNWTPGGADIVYMELKHGF